jgi:hypothetical protein
MASGHCRRSSSPRSRDIGLDILLLSCGERVEIDALRIVVREVTMNPSTAMNVHQGLHAPGV